MSLSSGRPPLHEGLPGHAGHSGASSSRGPAPPRGTAGQPKAKTTKAARGNDKTSKEICNAYNAGTGACGAGGATCKYGRRHVCAVCEEGHQAFKVHPDKYSPPAEFRPKGGGGRGEKRKQ